MSYNAVRPDNATCTNRDALENRYSGTDPRPLAYSYRLDLFVAGKPIGDSLLQSSRMAIVIADLAASRDQDIIFDNYFAVAGDGDIVPYKRSVPNAQRRAIMESARNNREAAAELDIVANIESGVSLNIGQSPQLQMFTHGFTPAAEYGGGEEERFDASPKRWNVNPQSVEKSTGGLEHSRHRESRRETKIDGLAGNPKEGCIRSF